MVDGSAAHEEPGDGRPRWSFGTGDAGLIAWSTNATKHRLAAGRSSCHFDGRYPSCSGQVCLERGGDSLLWKVLGEVVTSTWTMNRKLGLCRRRIGVGKRRCETSSTSTMGQRTGLLMPF